MKKILVIFSLLLFAVGLNAQTSGKTYSFLGSVVGKTAFSYTRNTVYTATQLKDSIGGTASKYWIFYINKPALYYWQLDCVYDTIFYKAPGQKTMRVVGNHVIIKVEGSIDGVHWTQIDSTLFHPTTRYVPAGDYGKLRSVKMKDVSAGSLYPWLKVTATGLDAGKCALISNLALQVGLRY